MDQSSLPVPFPHAYWVIPEKLMAGGYPGRKREDLSGIYKFGISRIINLMEIGERMETGKPYPDYHPNIYRENQCHLCYTTITWKPIKRGIVPTVATMNEILDKIEVAISRGRRIYVHSLEGRGRVGTVVGCFLVRHGMAGDEALERIMSLRLGIPDGHLTSPATQAQRQMVLDWKRLGIAPKDAKDWSVYILRCRDGSLYTGIAKDVQARVKQHNFGRGGAYTRSRLPVELTYQEDGMNHSEALVRETEIKRLPPAIKEEIILGGKE